MKRDKNFTWRRIDPASLGLQGIKVAIVGGTGGIGRALSRFMASRGEGTLRSRFVEWMIGLVNPSVETYAERLTPLLVSPDLEAHNGAMFDQKGNAILASPKLRDAAYVTAFIAASEALVAARANVRVSP